MSIIARLLVLVIRGYQLMLSPILGVNCRFTPTCSSYAIEAITSHGLIKGFFLSCHRFSRCHPFAECGCDPVPPARTKHINSVNKV